jgi:hypothetical protein
MSSSGVGNDRSPPLKRDAYAERPRLCLSACFQVDRFFRDSVLRRFLRRTRCAATFSIQEQLRFSNRGFAGRSRRLKDGARYPFSVVRRALMRT